MIKEITTIRSCYFEPNDEIRITGLNAVASYLERETDKLLEQIDYFEGTGSFGADLESIERLSKALENMKTVVDNFPVL